jgi:biopolymer transport protein ExbB
MARYWRFLLMVSLHGCLHLVGSLLAMQASPASTAAPASSSGSSSALDLFLKSFDGFTIILLLASVAAGAVIVRAIMEIRPKVIVSSDSEKQIRRMLEAGNLDGLSSYLQRDASFYGHVMRSALASGNLPGADRTAIRSAAEMAASEQCGRHFRVIEPLSVIGNLGPLLGLAGTVWGMVAAFSELSGGAGQASPARLSGGIADALFHTLLGLLVALPALLVFGLYRTKIDGMCTRAMAISGEMVEAYCVVRERASSTAASTTQGASGWNSGLKQ